MKKIRLLLADDHTLVRKGIRSLLEDEADLEVVGEAEDGYDTLAKVVELAPDLVVIDIGMPSLNGIEAVRRIKKERPAVRLLILTMHDNEAYITETLQAGADGYVLKKSGPRELINAIRIVMGGESYLSPAISTKMINRYIRQPADPKREQGVEGNLLTAREREIVQLIAEGHSNKDIARKLGISLKTVKNHRGNLMEKLDLHNTAEITQYAIRQGMVIFDST